MRSSEEWVRERSTKIEYNGTRVEFFCYTGAFYIVFTVFATRNSGIDISLCE